MQLNLSHAWFPNRRQRKVGTKYVEIGDNDFDTVGAGEATGDARRRAERRKNKQYRDVPRARKPGVDWMDGVKAKPHFLFSVKHENDTPLIAAQQLGVKVQQLCGVNKDWYPDISTNIRFKQGTLLQIPDTPGAMPGTVPFNSLTQKDLYGRERAKEQPDESDDEWGFVRKIARSSSDGAAAVAASSSSKKSRHRSSSSSSSNKETTWQVWSNGSAGGPGLLELGVQFPELNRPTGRWLRCVASPLSSSPLLASSGTDSTSHRSA